MTLRDLILTALCPPGGEPMGTDQMARDFALMARHSPDLPSDVSPAAVARECKAMAREGLIAYRGVVWEFVPQAPAAVVKRGEQKELF